MIIDTGLPYWEFRTKYAALPEVTKKLVLSGDALLILRDTTSDAVKRRLQAFITFECNRLRVADKTANFV